MDNKKEDRGVLEELGVFDLLMTLYLTINDMEKKSDRSFRVEGTHETSYHAGRAAAFREARMEVSEILRELGLAPWLKEIHKEEK